MAYEISQNSKAYDSSGSEKHPTTKSQTEDVEERADAVEGSTDPDTLKQPDENIRPRQ